MKPQRSYSDPEIARYVLGLDLADQAQGMQALLAHDDAAAARALKWEAYLLGIVDALPATQPPDTILLQIQQTLGMTFEASATPVLGETRERSRPPAGGTRQVAWPAWLQGSKWRHRLAMPWARLTMTRRPSNRTLWIAGVAAVVIVALAALVISASLHTTSPTVVHQAITTQGQ